MLNFFVTFKVYNDADILEKIMKDRRRDLGPATDEDDMMSPKLKISTLSDRADLRHVVKSEEISAIVAHQAMGRLVVINTQTLCFNCRKEQHYSEKVKVPNTVTAEAE